MNRDYRSIVPTLAIADAADYLENLLRELLASEQAVDDIISYIQQFGRQNEVYVDWKSIVAMYGTEEQLELAIEDEEERYAADFLFEMLNSAREISKEREDFVLHVLAQCTQDPYQIFWTYIEELNYYRAALTRTEQNVILTMLNYFDLDIYKVLDRLYEGHVKLFLEEVSAQV